ncbi:MAG: hypothetical protein KAI73_05075 [Rhodospirillaceae bacterium]|nr:hypothetical protein [Rhodospirillaceae bacterium]
MPFVERDAQNKIKAIYGTSHPQAQEYLPDDDAEVLAFRGEDLVGIKLIKTIAIDTLRDAKKLLPILTEGEQVDAGTLSSGAMANELFAYDGKSMAITSITRSGSEATVTFDKNHHLDEEQSFSISGAGEAEYNDDFAAETIVDKKIVTITVAGTPATPATGTITALVKDYPWIDYLNNTVFWSAPKFKAIHRDTTKYERDCVKRGRVLKNLVLAAADVAAVDAIDITAGWPDTGI